MSATVAVFNRPVLADRLPTGITRDVILVSAAAALTALMAQISVPVPGSPVPVTGQTFAVLLSAAAIGPLRGVNGQILYVALGAAGLPVFADAGHGYAEITGATGGYLLGFCIASLVIGLSARAGFDRTPRGLAAAFLLSSAVIYVPGVLWLQHWSHSSLGSAMHAGVYPYLIGDLIKAILAAALLPTAWRVVR